MLFPNRVVVVLALAAVLTLGACAARPGAAGRPAGTVRSTAPVPAACRVAAVAPAPDGAAAAMVRIARGEWHKWGERVVELQPGRTVVAMPSGLPAVWEQERDAFPYLAEYWCATPPNRNHWELSARAAGFSSVMAPDGSIDKTAFERTPIGDSPFNEPWSAAFTSWVVLMAGVPESRFRLSDTHWDYVSDIMMAPPGSRAFRARGIDSGPPAAGDLLCATRSGLPPANWQDLAYEGTRPMHCDIVTGMAPCGFSPSGRCVEAIGGNVMQSVSLTRIPVDLTGRLLAGGGAGRDWVVILQNLGR